ncbi:hypothetical protein [Streptomyces sp. NPDC004284]|uniref:hypothetical protein n=1 Tax=Streptomyces sp. NPDC004284 TaxID=3364695 RepID=UPI00369F8F44
MPEDENGSLNLLQQLPPLVLGIRVLPGSGHDPGRFRGQSASPAAAVRLEGGGQPAEGAVDAALAKAGAAWGDDEPGRQFHDTYGPIVERIQHSAGIIKEGLASIHTAMVDMADGHIENEALIEAMFRKVVPAADEGPDGPGRQE